MSLVGLWSGAAMAASIWANVTITHATLLSHYYTQQYSRSLNPDNIIDKFKESPTWKWINSIIPTPANDFGNGFTSSFTRAPSKKPVTSPTRTFDNLDLDDASTTPYPVTTDLSPWFAHAPSPARTTLPRVDSPVTQTLLITSTAPPVGYAILGHPSATVVTSPPGAGSRHAAPLVFEHPLGADGLEVDEQEPESPGRAPSTPREAHAYLGIAAACVIAFSVFIGAHKIFNKKPYVGCPTREPVVVINTSNGQFHVMLDASGDYSVIANARDDVIEQGSMNYGPDNSCFFYTANGIPQRVLFCEGSVDLPPSFIVSPDISLANETMWESTPVKKRTYTLLPRTPARIRTPITRKRLLVDELFTTSKPILDSQHSDSPEPASEAQVQNVVK
ncbi:hypothetical protein BDV93DRAFT_565031 [Ceratobasidium sp. AG-I]|nr:hypothetical protein BDV93DRAFT_565031 [Ceratobasidium sp. AG-I]